MKIMYGALRCMVCKLVCQSSWALAAPRLICHECGNDMVPEGVQVPIASAPNLTASGVEWQIRNQQVRRLES